MHQPTPQQSALWSTATDPSLSVAVSAVAGSGKTFSAQQWANLCPGTGLATSFSKSTVTELGKKMPAKFPSRTMHGIGKDAIANSGRFKKIDSNKVGSIAKDLCAEHDLSWQLIAPISQLVSQAKTAGIVPNQDNGLCLNIYETWEMLAEQFDIHFSPEVYDIARQALEKSNELALKEGIIDFDDMLYIPLFWPHRFSRYKTVIVDEAQDLNPLQHRMISRILLPGARIFACGDPNQAIYAFRGAMHDSYSELVSRFSMSEMPLTVSFRCPKAVVREAQQYVPHIESAPNAIEGAVIHHDSLSVHELPRTILCRNNAPLVQLALRCLIQGISAEVAGKDIGKGLISLTKRIASGKTSDTTPVRTFIERLHRWAESEISKKPRRKPSIQDKVVALEAISSMHRTLGDVRKHLEKLYVDPEDQSRSPAQLHLTTIHKAKGREWPEVLFLDPHLLPSKYAEQEWELQQEANLAYVGITRAQETLHYCALADIA